MSNQPAGVRRGQPFVLLITTILALLFASAPISVPALAEYEHNQQINDPAYIKEKGRWDIIDLPEEFRINTIHAALLPTGKVLLVAGSGNNEENFNKFHEDGKIAVLRTVVFNPEDNSVKNVVTPEDFFCGGHSMLQSGNLLVAGGTSGYEKLEGKVSKPAGSMTIHNEDPDSQQRTFKKGTKFISPAGKAYISTNDVVVEPASKMDHGDGDVMIHHSSATVFVEAEKADVSYITKGQNQYQIEGLKGSDVQNIYGQAGPMTLNKQDFRGDNVSYEFDPVREEYVKTSDLNVSRWYPTLTTLTDGNVIATSGLDNAGVITTTTEEYNPATKKWTLGPNQQFPTYPALFRTQNPDVLFYSGSSAGYGPVDKGRSPGFWNYKSNTFSPVAGLRQQNILETSGSVALPPAKASNDGSQSHRIMVAGGGGIGESPLATARTDIIDLSNAQPHYTPGPDLPAALRYLNLVVTPWDEVIANGGSANYRAKDNSYSKQTFSIDPATNKITPLADELVGRSYHSGSLLLPDGRIIVFGNDPLYSDKDNTAPGKFDQRLEIYTPPQLYRGDRPTLTGGPALQQVQRGQTLSYAFSNASTIRTGRMIPPSSTTHVTNVEQRSIGVIVKQENDQVTFTLPGDKNLMPNGWYMLFAVNESGTPSIAKMIQVTD
ncbi:MAG TPA: galactose oxidase early set domain-containing protein [Candidatus Saccharimonadales bacterium]